MFIANLTIYGDSELIAKQLHVEKSVRKEKLLLIIVEQNSYSHNLRSWVIHVQQATNAKANVLPELPPSFSFVENETTVSC